MLRAISCAWRIVKRVAPSIELCVVIPAVEPASYLHVSYGHRAYASDMYNLHTLENMNIDVASRFRLLVFVCLSVSLYEVCLYPVGRGLQINK